MVVPTEDSVITEMTSTLRDWGALWKQLYVVGVSPRPALGGSRQKCLGGARGLTPERLQEPPLPRAQCRGVFVGPPCARAGV